MPTLNDQGDNEALKKKLKASIAAKRNKDNKETSNGHQVRHQLETQNICFWLFCFCLWPTRYGLLFICFPNVFFFIRRCWLCFSYVVGKSQCVRPMIISGMFVIGLLFLESMCGGIETFTVLFPALRCLSADIGRTSGAVHCSP